MKLIIVLSVIACGYAAKLDRTYLPPSSAATAGGSPGAITAPNSGFGRGSAADFGNDLPSGPTFGQNVPSGLSNQASGFSGSRPSFGPTGIQGSSQANFPGSQPSFGQTGSQGSDQASLQESRPSFGQPGNQGPNQPGTSFKDNKIGSDDSRPNQGSKTPFDQAQQSSPERPQAESDRNAEILKYVNENNGDSYEYSYETSNGISAGESGVATNGVMAQGGYSYTGDDGKPYSITYTADENGFQPQGEHLPTPHPIPEEILKSIEDNARAAATGTQEGAYRPEEYESEISLQQYGNGPQGLQQGSTFPGSSSQRKPDQGSQRDRQQAQTQYSQEGNNNNYPEASGQQSPSQQPFGNAFNAQKDQLQDGNGYNYNAPTQNQGQRRPSQRPSQTFGNIQDNEISGPADRPNQFNQPQRNQPARQPQGFNNQNDQYSPQQNGQSQGENGYNYKRPQTTPELQSPGQGNRREQPQKPFSGLGNNQELSGQLEGQRPSNVNQQRSESPRNQFGAQSQNTPSQTGQKQKNNGYTYNQPQGPRNSAQGSQSPQDSQGSRFSGNQPNNNVFGQQTSQTARDYNQAQRPTSDSNNAFGGPQGPSNQYPQGPKVQDQRENGYNYNQPQKPDSRPGQSPTYSQDLTSQGPQAGPKNQFGQPQRPSQGPFSGNQQGPSNKFPSGQRGQDQDENGYYYNRPQNTQSQGPFGQRPQSGAPNQSGFSPRPTSGFDSNNQGSGPMRPAIGQNRPGLKTDREEYSPENIPSFGSGNPERTRGSDSSRPTEKFQPSLTPASQFRPQQPGQSRPFFGPSDQDAPIQTQNKPSFGPSAGNSLSQNKPTSFGPTNVPGQTLAQGYQYGPGSNNQQRPGPNGAPGATKGPGSEFEGPRQPPSFSPEEGYKY